MTTDERVHELIQIHDLYNKESLTDWYREYSDDLDNPHIPATIWTQVVLQVRKYHSDKTLDQIVENRLKS